MTTNRVQRFAEAASEYCAWCQSQPGSELEEARAALRQLSRLYVLAQDLRELDDVPDAEADRIDHPEWRTAFERFGALPFNFYASILDPRKVGAAQIGTEDLADDLADIYRDLSAGLSLFRAGRTDAAEWEWAWSFRCHWGRHATSAIYALHCWFSDEGVW